MVKMGNFMLRIFKKSSFRSPRGKRTEGKMETKGHVDRRNSTAAHIYMSGTVLGALCAHLMNRHSSRR